MHQCKRMDFLKIFYNNFRPAKDVVDVPFIFLCDFFRFGIIDFPISPVVARENTAEVCGHSNPFPTAQLQNAGNASCLLRRLASRPSPGTVRVVHHSSTTVSVTALSTVSGMAIRDVGRASSVGFFRFRASPVVTEI